jgi:hypothetical protein
VSEDEAVGDISSERADRVTRWHTDQPPAREADVASSGARGAGWRDERSHRGGAVRRHHPEPGVRPGEAHPATARPTGGRPARSLPGFEQVGTTRRTVTRGLAGLSPDQRRCVELRDLRDGSVAATARAVTGAAQMANTLGVAPRVCTYVTVDLPYDKGTATAMGRANTSHDGSVSGIASAHLRAAGQGTRPQHFRVSRDQRRQDARAEVHGGRGAAAATRGLIGSDPAHTKTPRHSWPATRGALAQLLHDWRSHVRLYLSRSISTTSTDPYAARVVTTPTAPRPPTRHRTASDTATASIQSPQPCRRRGLATPSNHTRATTCPSRTPRVPCEKEAYLTLP